MVQLFSSCIILLFCLATPLAQSIAQKSQDCVEIREQLNRAQARLNDWPRLARYRGDNARVASPVRNELRVVFLGDSITDGWDDPVNGGFFPGKAYINRGISGQTTPQMLIRFRADVIALKPKVVVILAGTNDIAGNSGPTTIEAIEDNLTSMADLAHTYRIRVVLSSVLPVSDYEVRDGKSLLQTSKRPPEKIKALNQWLNKYCADHRLTYLDYYSAMVDEKGFLKSELSSDGLHPNLKGYAVMAPLVEKAITGALRVQKDFQKHLK
jgi:lysophospholipase L1-like esterase